MNENICSAVSEKQSADEAAKDKINQFGDYNNERLTIDAWQRRWEAGQTRFHMPQVHPMLQKYIDKLTGESSNARIFLPMCGKSMDIKWLAELGHRVVGNEVVDLGCKQIFEENNIEYSVSPISVIEGYIYKSTDPKYDITLYNCDFFQINSDVIGTLDGIWDRGSLAAVYDDERERYCQVILNLMRRETNYLTDTFHVDHDNFAGPPHDFPDELLNTLFDDTCSIEVLEHVDAMTSWQREWGVKYFTETVHLIKLKE